MEEEGDRQHDNKNVFTKMVPSGKVQPSLIKLSIARAVQPVPEQLNTGT